VEQGYPVCGARGLEALLPDEPHGGLKDRERQSLPFRQSTCTVIKSIGKRKEGDTKCPSRTSLSSIGS
jgi:hypothetical protein